VRVNGKSVAGSDITLRVPHAKVEVRLPMAVVQAVEAEKRAGGKASVSVELTVSGQASNTFVHTL